MRNLATLVLLSLACLPAINEACADELSLDQIAHSVVQSNPDLQAARYLVEEARGRLQQAGLPPNPELELTRNTDRSFSSEGDYTASVGLSQKFPISGRLARASDVARVDVQQAQAEVRDFERQAIQEALKAALDIYALDSQLAAYDASRQKLRQLVASSEKRFKEAETSQADLNLERIEFQKVEAAHAVLMVERQQRARELALKISHPRGDTLKIASSKIDGFAERLLAIDIQEALSIRPDRQLHALAIERAASQIRLAKAERFEDWTISLGVERDVANYDFIGAATQKDNFLSARLSVPLPLWNGNQGNIAVASAAQGRAQAELHAFDAHVKTEIESARGRVLGLRPLIERFERESLRLAESNVELISKSYRDGLVPISALIQAQQQVFQVRESYSRSVRDYFSALVDLEAALAANPALRKEEL
ncbi:MAG: TolC family protein [Oligoflexia bacterium]|nr:TolC family protein [Oligoflexia bacterium]